MTAKHDGIGKGKWEGEGGAGFMHKLCHNDVILRRIHLVGYITMM